MAVRNPAMVAFARHYGVTVHTCVPVDPASKGGSESSVKVAKADLVPKDTNLLDAYESFADLQDACEAFCAQVNARVHRVTRRTPDAMLAEERLRLHPVPADPHTVAFGLTRTVAAKTPMVTFDSGQYSVPHLLLGQTVWVRVHGRGADEQVVIVHVGATGPVEVARHARAIPGSPQMIDAHFPPPPAEALGRVPAAHDPGLCATTRRRCQAPDRACREVVLPRRRRLGAGTRGHGGGTSGAHDVARRREPAPGPAILRVASPAKG